MRSAWLILASLAAPLLSVSPAGAQILGPCCQREGESHPPDPHNRGPVFVPAEVKRADERSLEATAEASISVEVPLVNAVGVPLEARLGVSEPEHERVVELPSLLGDPNEPLVPDTESPNTPPCCQADAETHPPDRRPEETAPVLISAKVRNREKEHLLQMGAELPIPTEAPLVNAIAIPFEARPGVSDPPHLPASVDRRALLQGPEIEGPSCCMPDRRRPVPVDAPLNWLRAIKASAELLISIFTVLLAIGLLISRRGRRPARALKPRLPIGPLPDELPPAGTAPLPRFEPEVALANERLRRAERELV